MYRWPPKLLAVLSKDFLAQNGNPNDFARGFCRSPEIVELSCMPPYGTVFDYTEDGEPLFGDEALHPKQRHEVSIVQRGARDFAARLCDLIADTPAPPDFCSAGWRHQMRAIATRMVLYPTAEEAKLFGHWLADSDMGVASPRPILSKGPHAERLAQMTAAEIIALPRRDLPWLYAIVASFDHAKARQVASLMLRREPSDTFVV